MSHKLLVVTGNAADWGWLEPIVDDLAETEEIHILSLWGGGIIHNSKTKVTPLLDTVSDMGYFHAEAAAAVHDFISRYHPGEFDAAIVLGDRVEIFGAVSALFINRVPIHHIGAGDKSGCIDDAIRDAISVLSEHLYVTSPFASKRVHKMASASCPFMETATLVQLSIPVDDLEMVKVGFFPPFALVRFHPETATEEDVASYIQEVCARAITDNVRLFIFPPNRDTGWEKIEEAWNKYALHDTRIDAVVCLRPVPRKQYVAMLKRAVWVAGNSSSFIHEAPVVRSDGIHIYGSRQNGRPPLDMKRGLPIANAIRLNL